MKKPNLVTENLTPVLPGLDTRELGHPVFYYEAIDSTNTEIRRLAEAGAPAGSVAIARRQYGGRGRRGRSFFSAEGGLYLSVLLRLRLSPEDTALLTTAAAVAAVAAVRRLTGLLLGIKWVNDLFWQGKKLAGILSELVTDTEGKVDYAIVGIGINLQPVQLPPELESTVGFLDQVTASPTDPKTLAAAFLTELEPLVKGLPDVSFLQAYRRNSLVIGRRVTVMDAHGAYTADAIDVDDRGGLVIRLPDGTQKVLSSGEISIRL